MDAFDHRAITCEPLTALLCTLRGQGSLSNRFVELAGSRVGFRGASTVDIVSRRVG